MEIPHLILIFAGLLVVLILLLILFYPLFHILFTKLFFGKFSAKYIDVHKKYTGKSPYGYCFKDDFVNRIAAFYKTKTSVPVYQSEQEILFGKLKFGARFREIFKSNPKPFCVNSFRLEQFDLKMLGYRSEMFEAEIKSYYYFIDNRLFMGEYTFKSPSDDKLNEVAHVIRKKYLEGKKLDNYNFRIDGANNASLRFEHTGFYLSIKYLDQSNQEINDKIEQYWNSAIKKGFEEVSDFETELYDKL
jgi:hypothetical protein